MDKVACQIEGGLRMSIRSCHARSTGCLSLVESDYATVGRGLMHILSREGHRASAIRALLIAEVMDRDEPAATAAAKRTVMLDC